MLATSVIWVGPEAATPSTWPGSGRTSRASRRSSHSQLTARRSGELDALLRNRCLITDSICEYVRIHTYLVYVPAICLEPPAESSHSRHRLRRTSTATRIRLRVVTIETQSKRETFAPFERIIRFVHSSSSWELNPAGMHNSFTSVPDNYTCLPQRYKLH